MLHLTVLLTTLLLQPLPAAEPNKKPAKREMVVTAGDRQHWSFTPLQNPLLPSVKDSKWSKTPIDQFILSKLEKNGLAPSSAASRQKLIRRVYFDLIGLPPGPENIDAFVKDRSPDAYEKLVDRLLANPHYGERWGRHWLDLARYADSNGYENDGDRPDAWHYRDFVIQALNDDLPYDTFIQWQLAGDELAPDDPAALAATGFLAAALHQTTSTKLKEELERYRSDELDDILSTTGSAMLGLTLGCARCHDHKYDPIPTRDYYRMLAAFTTTERKEKFLASRADLARYKQAGGDFTQRVATAQEEFRQWLETEKKPLAKLLREQKVAALKVGDDGKTLLLSADPTDKKFQELSKQFEKQLELSNDDFRKAFTPQQVAEWDRRQNEIKAIENLKPKAPPTGLVITDRSSTPAESFLKARGDPLMDKEKVELGFLTVLTGKKSPKDYLAVADRESETRTGGESHPGTTGQRRAMAEWLTDTDCGAGNLVARVIVNRLWQHHFGDGLVRTPSDFGSQGELPSHSELLEWLAGELIRNGWRLKPLHKLIMTSAVYLQDSAFDEKKAGLDPENRLLWRRRPMRLESEILRDSILAVSGCLGTNMFGPGIKPPIPPELHLAFNSHDPYPKDAKDSPDTWRRSVYLFHKRSSRFPMMEVFDAADASASCARRIPTTVAPQALLLLNDAFVRNRAKDFAKRLVAGVEDGDAHLVERAYRLALGRMPTAAESRASLQFLEQPTRARAAKSVSNKENEIKPPSNGSKNLEAHTLALADVCQVLFSLNEFLYVD